MIEEEAGDRPLACPVNVGLCAIRHSFASGAPDMSRGHIIAFIHLATIPLIQ